MEENGGGGGGGGGEEKRERKRGTTEGKVEGEERAGVPEKENKCVEERKEGWLSSFLQLVIRLREVTGDISGSFEFWGGEASSAYSHADTYQHNE